LGHPYKFQRVLRLCSVTARHLVVGVSQTLRRWTEGATYIRQGDHHVGHWPTSLVLKVRMLLSVSCAWHVRWLFACRSQESSKRNSVDLCICVYQCRGTEAAGGAVGPLLCCSKREVRYFAGTNCFLEPGVYLVFAMAFNHWSLVGMSYLPRIC